MGYLAKFIGKLEWWNLFPAQDLLTHQPGEEVYNHFVSVVKSTDSKTILAYLPVKLTVKIRKPLEGSWKVMWFDPVKNAYYPGSAIDDGAVLTADSPSDSDLLLILTFSPPSR
jgi:hypothetical protein